MKPFAGLITLFRRMWSFVTGPHAKDINSGMEILMDVLEHAS